MMEMQDAGRGPKEQRKRKWEDYQIYNDEHGQYVKAYEASGTKCINKESDRMCNKIYGRPDKFGFVDFLSIYASMRPKITDIKRKANKSGLETAFFLRGKLAVEKRADGSLLGFLNLPMGSAALSHLWTNICKDFNIPRCTLYGLRQTLCTSYVKNGCTIFQAAAVTKHRSMNALCRYQQDKDLEERKSDIVQNYMNAHIDQSTHTYNNHVLRIMGHGNDNDNHNHNHNRNQNYYDNHNQYHTHGETNVPVTIPEIDVSGMPRIQLPDLSEFLQSATTDNSCGYKATRGVSKTCANLRHNPIETKELDKTERD